MGKGDMKRSEELLQINELTYFDQYAGEKIDLPELEKMGVAEWTALHLMLSNNSISEMNQVTLLRILANRKDLHVHQFLRARPQGRTDVPDYGSVPEEAYALALCVYHKNIVALKFLLSGHFENVWSIAHINFIIKIALRLELVDFVVEILKSFACERAYTALS